MLNSDVGCRYPKHVARLIIMVLALTLMHSWENITKMQVFFPSLDMEDELYFLDVLFFYL